MSEFSKSNSTSQSEDIRQFAQAFAKAKKEFKKTGMSGKTDKFKYPKLFEIYEAVEGSLSDNNISIWHCADALDSGMEILKSRLTHDLSGQYIEDRRFITSEKPGNQSKGAANTYMKKYAVLSMCAIDSEEDDNCQEEEKYIEKMKIEKPLRIPVKGPTISEEQVNTVITALKASPKAKTIWENILKFNQISDLIELKAASYESVMNYIKNYKD